MYTCSVCIGKMAYMQEGQCFSYKAIVCRDAVWLTDFLCIIDDLYACSACMGKMAYMLMLHYYCCPYQGMLAAAEVVS